MQWYNDQDGSRPVYILEHVVKPKSRVQGDNPVNSKKYPLGSSKPNAKNVKTSWNKEMSALCIRKKSRYKLADPWKTKKVQANLHG